MRKLSMTSSDLSGRGSGIDERERELQERDSRERFQREIPERDSRERDLREI